jgi:hypothetical protein
MGNKSIADVSLPPFAFSLLVAFIKHVTWWKNFIFLKKGKDSDLCVECKQPNSEGEASGFL